MQTRDFDSDSILEKNRDFDLNFKKIVTPLVIIVLFEHKITHARVQK